jgi:hypothetical protein
MDANKQEKHSNVKAKISTYFQKGLSYEQAFVQLCADLGLPAIPSENLEKAFQYIAGNVAFDGFGLDQKYRSLLFTLVAEYRLLQNGLASWPTDCKKSYTFKYLDSRYAFLFEQQDNELQLFLLDNYHEQKR